MIHSILTMFQELMQILHLAFRDRIQILFTAVVVFAAAVSVTLLLPPAYTATVTLAIQTESPIDRRSRGTLAWTKLALSEPVLLALQAQLPQQNGAEVDGLRKKLRANTPHHWSKLELKAVASDAPAAKHIATQWAEIIKGTAAKTAHWRAQSATSATLSPRSRFRIWRIGILAAICAGSVMSVRSAVRHGNNANGEKL